jgi:hypothetical protein
MRPYYVEFVRGGETESQIVRYRVGSIGSAFDKCLREFSEAKLIKGWVEGSYKDGHGITVYAPPSRARIVAEPALEEEQTAFEFFFSCREEPAVNRGISLRTNQTCRMQPTK